MYASMTKDEGNERAFKVFGTSFIEYNSKLSIGDSMWPRE
jgi:hypothetical protein